MSKKTFDLKDIQVTGATIYKHGIMHSLLCEKCGWKWSIWASDLNKDIQCIQCERAKVDKMRRRKIVVPF